MGKISAQMDLFVDGRTLIKYRAYSHIRGINLDYELSPGIRRYENGCCGEQLLKFIKCELSSIGPVEVLL